MKLKKLFKDLDVKIMGNKDIAITGLTAHSKKTAPGNLFIAKNGLTCHGADFIPEAMLGGAKAILTDLYNPFLKGVTQIIHPEPEKLEATLADRFYNHPAKNLFMIGITGTNGKTTTSYLARQLIGLKTCALIGTIEYLVGNNQIAADFTTPDVITNHKLLSMANENHLKFCIMEVTSHGLEQKRVEKIPFNIACFTNISLEHLDYHKTMDAYISAKEKLFLSLSKDDVAIVNADDPASEKMIQNCKANIFTYGLKKSADIRAENVKYSPSNIKFDLNIKQERYPLTVPLVGSFNLYNSLAAIAIAYTAKIAIKTILERAQFFIPPRGRLQPIPNRLGAQIFVDFAHSPDALKNTLQTLKDLKHKRVITVFGCGGDRDQDKRPLMGQIVSELSDISFITSDNPRSEEPRTICDAILKGCDKKAKIYVEVDRYEAIEQAIKLAKRGDIVLIAGRGHENHQIIAHKRIPFNDANVVAKILERF